MGFRFFAFMSNQIKKKIGLIGGGPANMLLACHLDTNKYDVTIHERNPALGRKFLVAGKGGFNLTHGEHIDNLKSRYTPKGVFNDCLNTFDNEALRNWFSTIGIETYSGSSNRVFPVKGIKPVEVLNAILQELKRKNVAIKTNHTWDGFQIAEDKVSLLINDQVLEYDFTVFGLGGGSWQKTGSKGDWLEYFECSGVKTNAFMPSNCAYKVNWDKQFIQNHEGKPLKNIALKGGSTTQKGELIITAFGLEGGAIYALSPEIRQELTKGKATVYLDLKPTLSLETTREKLSRNQGNQSWSNFIKSSLKLSSVQLAILKSNSDKATFNDVNLLAKLLKNIPIELVDFAPLDEAISTVGGIKLSEISDRFELKKLPQHFVIGEMLDWDAPTGGYLLQACMSMGVHLAKELNKL